MKGNRKVNSAPYCHAKPAILRKGRSVVRRFQNRCRYLRDARVLFPEERTAFPNCVIGNAVPKSGTYLLNSIFNYLGNWKNIGIHILHNHYIDFGDYRRADTPRIYRPASKSVRSLRNGQLAAAHLTWNRELNEVMSEQREDHALKHVFMVRDPRDTAVSYMKYITYGKGFLHDKQTRRERRFMLDRFRNDAERLEFAIKKRLVKGELSGYLNWLNHPNTFLVRFEELYPELCRMNIEGFGPTFMGLFEYLEVDMESHDPTSFQEGVLGKGYTSSGLKDKVAQYKKTFKERHYALIDNAEFKEMLEKFGYKW